MRTVGAELRAAAAGQKWKRPSGGSSGEWDRHSAPDARANQIPAGKRKRREVLDRCALHTTGQRLARREPRDRLFRLADDNEVGVLLEEFREFRSRQTDEAGS